MKVLRVSEDCITFLTQSPGQTGEVHSTFERAVNLLFSNGVLMTIVSDQMDLAPMTIQVSKGSLKSLGWHPGMPVSCSGEGIFVGETPLEFTRAEKWIASWDNRMPPAEQLTRAEMLKRLETFTKLLLVRGRPEGLLPYLCETRVLPHPGSCPADMAGNRYVAFVKGRLDQFVEAYRDGTDMGETRATAAFLRLVGFGPGLTPSSDDFVAGFMAANLCAPYGQFMAREKLLKRNQRLVSQAKGKTTVISEAMLAHAALGHVAQKYGRLLNMLCFELEGDLEAAALNALDHGDTSGTDFMTGAAAALMLSLNA
jgi:hypothetical protein